jgi:hypothetical protein
MRIGRLGIGGLLAGCLLLLSGGASAGTLKEACQDDVKKLCKNVKAGKGRIFRCLKAKEGQVSEACKTEVAAKKEALQKFTEACKADVKTHCAKVKPGGGRILACLKGAQANLQPDCKAYFEKGETPDEESED